MSNYLKIILSNKNEFRIDTDISISSLGINKVHNISVKIDTGCPYTSIPVQKLGISKSQAQVMKQKDSLDKAIQKDISFGVNDTQSDRQVALALFKTGNYMMLKQITYIHNDLEINFGGVIVHKQNVKVSYDRSGNILIGMDILKDWDIHIGTIDTGETIFLGCPKDQINDEYLQELENTFNIASSINASLIKKHIGQQ